MYQFSECGQRLAYYEYNENQDQGYSELRRIHVYEIKDDHICVCKLMDEPVSGCQLPLLSDNGCSLLVCSQRGKIKVRRIKTVANSLTWGAGVSKVDFRW